MKKIFLILILGMFMISFVSAFGFDNVKKFNKNTQTITIKKSFLWIPTTTIAEITLNTPQFYRVSPGYTEIAELTVRADRDYREAFKKISFYDIKNGKEKIYRSTNNNTIPKNQ